MNNKRFILAAIGLFFPVLLLAAYSMTDAEVRQVIIQGSINAYVERYGAGGCPCPYSPGKSGHACGIDSGYYQGEGAIALRCYPRDITDAEVDAYRLEYGIPQRHNH